MKNARIEQVDFSWALRVLIKTGDPGVVDVFLRVLDHEGVGVSQELGDVACALADEEGMQAKVLRGLQSKKLFDQGYD